MKQRIYLVTHGETKRLIRAINRNQAMAFVAKSLIEVQVPSQDDLLEAAASGVSVEDARVDMDDSL